MHSDYTDRCSTLRLYGLSMGEDGRLYILGNLNLTPVTYDPLPCMNDILMALLQIGQAYIAGEDISFAVQRFCMRYGMLDFQKACIEKTYDDGSVKFYAGNVFGLKAATKRERCALFEPFPAECRRQMRRQSIARTEEIPAPDNGEPFVPALDFTCSEAVEWYGRYAASLVELLRHKQAGETMTLLPGNVELRYEIAGGEGTRKLYFDSLKSACDFAMLELLTSPTPAIRLCKRCGKPLLTRGRRSEYCSASCRNVANVARSRKRKREESLNHDMAKQRHPQLS